MKRLLLFVFLSFLIFIGVTRDWVNIRISLQDLHAAMNARALALKLKAIPKNKLRKNKDECKFLKLIILKLNNSLFIYFIFFFSIVYDDDNVHDIYSE